MKKLKVFWRSKRAKRAMTTLETILIIAVIVIAAFAGYFGYLALTPPPAPTPAEFELSNLVVSESLVTEGDSVIISVNVTNVSEAAVTGAITLSLNGGVQETKSITLEAGEEKTVEFTVTTSSGWAGDYNVLIGALPGTFSVRMAIKNPGTIIVATIGEPETVDPAWAYDTASAELIFNVYDTLVFFDGGATDKFVPMLATEWIEAAAPHADAPAGTNNTYYFKMRSGVKFHNGATLTTEDIEYSFERALVQDRSGGPVWMFYEPFLGRFHSRSGGSIVVNSTQLDNTVESNSTHVWFNLVMPYPPFIQILSQSWASIVNKAWAIEQGDWPGTWGNWTLYNDPEVSPLDSPAPVMIGSGPFKFEEWEKGTQWSIVKFDDYWQGPAKINRVIVKKVSEWATRKLMFTQGDADMVYVPRENIQEIQDVTGIRGVKDLPELAMTAAFFNFNISTTSSYVPKVGGVDKPNIFADKDMRLAFAHSFNWTAFIEDVWLGEASQPSSPIINGLPFHNPAAMKYSFNLTKAEEYFKKAWNGDVWANGFELTILFNIGNVARQTAAEMFRDNIESINSTMFDVRIVGVEWPVYLGQLVDYELTLFIIGWLADYPDPHNFAMPFMHTEGDFSFFQSYSNATVDALVEEGIRTVNATRRKEVYYELQQLYYDDVISVPLYQPLGRHWERDWLQGWFYNPIFPGEHFYELSKEY